LRAPTRRGRKACKSGHVPHITDLDLPWDRERHLQRLPVKDQPNTRSYSAAWASYVSVQPFLIYTAVESHTF
jgi:hypothetical protein